MQYVTEQDSKEQQETIQWNSIQADDTIHYASIGYNVNQYMTVQRNTIHCSSIRHWTIQYNAIQ